MFGFKQMIHLLLVLGFIHSVRIFCAFTIHVFLHKYLLSTYHMPGSVLDAQDPGVNRRDDVLCSRSPETGTLVERDDQ